ncbi:DHA2 family efflux MFS transporter permease subunit [Paraburkholderia megapolitana]|uniref:MFS transporter, DHA2 family, multidrug resistance protein n=1 Tax=Paraburkholderia megapolitana TaxID=420953 RepID=A0A1I3IRR6_9BURK|nr:DHA2 family efflux MFS transporter permease subunit [Paraburkholderia megapolitana]QDQ85078.1 DHA2 family efflux MFS transporter permease subunit [Paraburkholderia megapolitana]SFI50567.1 MFS transporter, DHA2 family, multidrug resistance protein [Paraburkholderia megapolitana]
MRLFAATAAPMRPLEPMSGPALVFVAIAISVANFMQTLDLTIANVAVPTIAGDLGVAPDMGTWMLTSFATPLAITLPLTGWLAQRFGQVRLFRIAVVLFVLTSILCGLAPNFESLLVFRALQGAASGPITALSQALLVAVFPAKKRNVALSVWQTTTFVAPVLGPIAGGWITDNLTWPCIFYVNAPTGAIVLLVLTRCLAGRDNPTRKLPVDVVGLLLLAASFGSLQLLLDRGQNLDWFSATPIRVLAAIAAVSFVALILWELTDAHPIVDLRLFADRNFTAGTIAVTLGFGVYYGALVLVPLWLQTEQGYTATWAGIATAPLGLAGIVIAPLIGRIQGRIDPRRLATVALVGWGAASFWRMGFNTDVPIGDIAGNSLLMGAATAFFITPLVSLSIAGLPRERLPAASGVQNALRRIGTSVATSIAPTYFERRSRVHTTYLVDRITPFDPAATDWINSLEHAGMSTRGALASVSRSIDVQAHMLALNDFSFGCLLLFGATLLTVWFIRYRRP